jgi:hypothetical protein
MKIESNIVSYGKDERVGWGRGGRGKKKAERIDDLNVKNDDI